MAWIVCQYCNERRQEPPRGAHHGKQCANCEARFCRHGSDTCSPKCDLEHLADSMRRAYARESPAAKRRRQRTHRRTWTASKRKAASRHMVAVRAGESPKQCRQRSKHRSAAWWDKTEIERKAINARVSAGMLAVHDKLSASQRVACRRKSPEAKAASLANVYLCHGKRARRRAVATRRDYQPEINRKIAKGVKRDWATTSTDKRHARIRKALWGGAKPYRLRNGRTVRLHSSWEAACANELLRLGVKFEMQVPFDLHPKTYVADFVLPRQHIILEVKGRPQAWERWPYIERRLRRHHSQWHVHVLPFKVQRHYPSLAALLADCNR